ncbi:hypothetical protein Tco_0569829 [Tanacetum coccineum]
MSDSDESGVTHTEISSPYEDLSDIGSPRADDHEFPEPPYMLEDPYAEAALQAPPSPDYVPGPEEPEQAPPSPDYVPGPEHDDDEIIAEDQPYAEDASPIAPSPDYVPETDPEADPEEDGDEDPEEDPIDYRWMEDEDDDMDVEIDEEAEEEHLAPAYPVVVALPATAPSAEINCYIFPTSITHYLMVFITTQIPFPLSTTTDTLSHLSHTQILFPTITTLSVLTTPPPIVLFNLGLSSCYIRMSAEAAATSIQYHYNHPSYFPYQTRLATTTPATSAPISFPPYIERTDLRQDSCDPERYVGYGITDSWDEIVETLQGSSYYRTIIELGAHMREFESMVRRDTDEIYTRLDDEQGQRQLLAGRVNMLFRDRRTHANTRQLMEIEMSEITELQSADHRRQRAIFDLLKTDRKRHEEMRELRASDRTRQQQLIQTLTAMQTLQRETIPLQGLVTTLQGQVTALQGQVMTLQGQVTALQGQQGLAGGPAQPELPEEAGSSS